MQKFQVLLLLILLLFLAGCDVISDWQDDETSIYFEGEVGIIFKNGVECLGENASPIQSDNVYVSPTGSDENSGRSPEEPLGTLAYAICNLRPGQTLNVMPGTYHESVILGAFGDADQPITIQGLGQGDQRPILEGASNRTMGIALVESANFVIQNLIFKNYTDEGVLILDGSQFTIRDNQFIDNGRASIDPDADGEGFGINVLGVSQVLIERNEAYGNGPGKERWENFTLGTGINTYEMTDSIIRDNLVQNTIGGGILVEDGENILVENNHIENNELDANGDYWDGGIWVDGSTNITLRGNTITGNHGPALTLSDEEARYPATSTGWLVEDNILTGNLFGVYVWNFGQCPAPEEAIRFSGNQVHDNSRDNFICSEWECGVGQACD